MMNETVKQRSSFTIAGKLKDYRLLIKFSLSFMVAFSAVISYLLAPNISYGWAKIILLFLGGLMITGSANAVNEISEKDTDALMHRTASRPLPSGRMSVTEAWTAAIIMIVGGLLILGFYFNWLAAGVAFASWFIYAYMYTPLKKVSSVSVLVGGIPGALPCLIGWVAGTGELNPLTTFIVAETGKEVSNIGGWVLFAIQFFWQFPHFWAIAWVAHKDYTNAGFKLMPSVEGPTKYSAIQSVIYSLVLIPIGMLPFLVGMSGMISFVIVLMANLFMVWQCVRLFREMERKAARRVMFSSYFYLPIVLLALLADKTW